MVDCEHLWEALHSGEPHTRFCHRCRVFVLDAPAMGNALRLAADGSKTREYVRLDGRIALMRAKTGTSHASKLEYVAALALVALVGSSLFQLARPGIELSLSQSFSTVVSQLQV